MTTKKEAGREQPYIVLGLDYYEELTLASIGKTYKLLALKFHPDKCKYQGLRDKYTKYFQIISNAYDEVREDYNDRPKRP